MVVSWPAGLMVCAAGLLALAGETSAQSLAATIRAAESEALPTMLDALEKAKTAGVSNVTVSQAESTVNVKAAADLSLLSEVATFASSSLSGIAMGFKQAIDGTETDVGKILAAFELAERAGVPEAEVSAARLVLTTSVATRLQAATAKVGTSGATAADMEELAGLAQIGYGIGSDPGMLKEATTAYENKMAGTFTAADLPFVEKAVAGADHARATVPTQLVAWIKAIDAVRSANELAGDCSATYAQCASAVRLAREASLPSNAELTEVETKAKTCAAAELGTSSAQGSGESALEYVRRLLATIEAAKDSGETAASLAALEATARSAASAEVARVLALDVGETGAIAAAFELAERAGANVTSSRTVLAGRVQTHLAAAKTAAQTRSAVSMEGLAKAILAGRKLAYSETELAVARELFESHLAGTFSAAEMDVVEAGAAFADHANAKVPAKVQEMARAAGLVREALAVPAGQAGKLERCASALQAAREAGLPQTAELTSLQDAAKTVALSDLDAVSTADLPTRLAVVRLAREALAGTTSLAAVEASAVAAATTALTAALTQDLANLGPINAAFEDAQLAGVPEATLAAGRASLAARWRTRLASAEAALATGKTAAAIEELGVTIKIGRKLLVSESDLASATKAYEGQMQGAFTAADVAFVEAAFDNADHANAKVPLRVAEMATASKKLAEAAGAASGSLDQLLAATAAAQQAGISSAAVTSAAQTQAAANLEAALADSRMNQISSALSGAVQAGLNSNDLNAGRVVLQAQGSAQLGFG